MSSQDFIMLIDGLFLWFYLSASWSIYSIRNDDRIVNIWFNLCVFLSCIGLAIECAYGLFVSILEYNFYIHPHYLILIGSLHCYTLFIYFIRKRYLRKRKEKQSIEKQSTEKDDSLKK
jgi:hypothetical protein